MIHRVCCAALALAGAAFTSGCRATLPFTPGDPRTAPVYGYTPIDPLPVESDSNDRNDLLASLPDETVRIAVGEVTGSGVVEFGTGKIGVAGRNYEVVLDYIKFTTVPGFVRTSSDVAGAPAYLVIPTDSAGQPTATPEAIVPVYIGVGLRLTASIHVQSGNVDLGNLFAIGLAAEAGRASGTLVVQTLGISGENTSVLIPMPGKIDDTTIQNAMVALGAIKSKLYDDSTEIVPRVLGVYNTLGGGEETINQFISSFLEKPVRLDVKTRQFRRG